MLKRIGKFYIDGFRNMRLGKTLWKLILLKLVAILFVLKTFYPDVLQRDYDTDAARAGHVLERLAQTDTLIPGESSGANPIE